jgi:hypothetical protein
VSSPVINTISRRTDCFNVERQKGDANTTADKFADGNSVDPHRFHSAHNVLDFFGKSCGVRSWLEKVTLVVKHLRVANSPPGPIASTNERQVKRTARLARFGPPLASRGHCTFETHALRRCAIPETKFEAGTISETLQKSNPFARIAEGEAGEEFF